MNLVLGVDAAWTATEPSGVALVAGVANDWRCLCVAPSYDAFIGCAFGRRVDWGRQTFTGNPPVIARLLSSARALAGADPTVVAVDMPIANGPFSGRRSADQSISLAFGGQGCSTHSPSETRPGPLGASLMADLHDAGYPLVTSRSGASSPERCTIEVYPHPALLGLLGRTYRVPYKVGNSSKYWKGATVEERIAKLLVEFTGIDSALRRVFGDTQLVFPPPDKVATLSHLKRFEDALDALVSAWVGVRFLRGAATPYGDSAAAIWVPGPSAAP